MFQNMLPCQRTARFFACALLAAAALCAAQDRILAPVDSTRTVSLPGHVHPSAQAQFDRGPADPAMPIRYATLLLKPAPAIDSFLTDLQTPSSPNYRHWLTPEQFGDRFGLTPADLAKLTAWLQSQGLTIHDVARGRHWIAFSGTAQTVGRAFHTRIRRYLVGGVSHFANATPPEVPAAFQSVIAGIEGLNDFSQQPMNVRGPDPQPFTNSGSNSHTLAPDDLATIYNISPLYAAGTSGDGQKIAVIGRTDVDLNDIRLFRSHFGLPANDPQLVRYGPDPGTTGDLVEADIDLEWSGAVARNAQIVYVYSTSIVTAAQYAVDQDIAPVISYSYGACELESPVTMRGIAQQANAQGITWFVASGDSGAAACDSNSPTPQATKGPTVAFPASLPEVTAVGGTGFNEGNTPGYWAASNGPTFASAVQYIPEKVWNDSSLTNSLEGGGGGASGYFPKPLWQTGPGVPDDHARDVPDVSLAASPNHWGYVIYTGGKQAVYGGTSVGSPVFAGIAALLNQRLAASTGSPSRLGNINPMLYRMAQSTQDVFHDISAGDNKVPCQQNSPGCFGGQLGYAAAAAYDLATGLGSVDVNAFIAEWNSGAVSTTTVSTTPAGSFDLNGTVTLIATVSGAGPAVPSGSVSFMVNDTAIATTPLVAAGGTEATATVSLPASLAAAGDGTVIAVFPGDAAYAGSSGSAGATLNLPTGSAVVLPFVSPSPIYEVGYTGAWNFTVTLSEKAGVAATLTGFTISGNNDLALFNTTQIPAHGAITASIASTGLTPPVNRLFTFTGTDANGKTWSQQMTVSFLGPIGSTLIPAMTLTSPISTVQQNPQADPSCQFAHPLVLQETGGFEITLTKLTVGGADMTSQLQPIFGTQRLAPFGMLRGVMCYPSTAALGTKAYVLTGASELGNTVTASLSTPLASAPAATAALSSSVPSLALSAPAGGDPVSSTFLLNLDGGRPVWTASVAPANRTSTWLSLAQTSGSGTTQLQATASAAGLSPGVYNAVINLQADSSLPQSVAVPVTFTVAPSTSSAITGLQNNFSYSPAFAPGMAMIVYGTNLAPATQQATRLPLPLSLNGVSATVNGISAPLYYISKSQVNIQVPYEAGAGPAVVAINNNGQIAAYTFTLVPAAPGLYASPISNSTGLPVTSANPGDVLLLFVTGEGDVSPSLATGATPSSSITDPTKLPKPRLPLTVTLGGESITPLFAGIPSGVAGVTQINLIVPADAPKGPQPVIVTVGGIASPPITLTIN